MLEAFVLANREVIIQRTRDRVALRVSPRASSAELMNGIPIFLTQLGDALRLARSTAIIDHAQIGESAARHGRDLFKMGLSVGQVVHDYGDVCQVVTELAVEQNAHLDAEQFRILNLCLDDAIAGAVTEYARQRESAIEDRGTERLGELAHELRNSLNTAVLSFETMKSGRVAINGSTGALLERSLMMLRDLIDRSLADVRLESGRQHVEPISIASFLEDIGIGAALEARARKVLFEVVTADASLVILADRQSLMAAISNLLHNAMKFTPRGGQVTLATRVTEGSLYFDVQDSCGGLPPGKAEELFEPFEQRGSDRSGLGLGLSICLKAAQAAGGHLSVRDLPGTGCIFTFEIPRRPSTQKD